MNTVVLDSSVWIEILNEGPLLKKCEAELKAAKEIIVPSVVLFEVYKKIAALTSEDLALSAITVLTRHSVADLTQDVALTAADLSIQYKLAMADSLVLAHAHTTKSILVTLDNDFTNLPNAKIIRK